MISYDNNSDSDDGTFTDSRGSDKVIGEIIFHV